MQGGWALFGTGGKGGSGVESYNANVTGGGAIAQGHGARAVGQGGVYINGDVHGDIVTGNKTSTRDKTDD